MRVLAASCEFVHLTSATAWSQFYLLCRLATFYSRSRKGRWCKGETSGNFIKVLKVFLDCDRDSIIYQGEPIGPACHTVCMTAICNKHMHGLAAWTGTYSETAPTRLLLPLTALDHCVVCSPKHAVLKAKCWCRVPGHAISQKWTKMMLVCKRLVTMSPGAICLQVVCLLWRTS